MKTVKQISVPDFRRHFHPALAAAWLGHSRLELHRHGVAVAALVSMDDLKRLEALEGTSVARERRAAPATGSGSWRRSVGELLFWHRTDRERHDAKCLPPPLP